MPIKHTLGEGTTLINGKIYRKKPREMSQFGKKSAKVYHSLYSSTEQLQVAL
jgi:ribosomal protein S24E